MNILDTQDKLKSLSQDQLMAEMKMPTGQAPQFLVLSEITRRQKMRESFSLEQGKDETTVAQDAVAAAGMSGQFAGDMARTMAPQTDTAGNTGAMPQQAMPPQSSPAPRTMSGGGIVALQEGGTVGGSDISSLMTDPTMMLMANRQGMSVQEYYDSLAPEAQAQNLSRVERSRMMALEPTVAGAPLAVNPSSAESTQGTFRAGDAFEDDRSGYIQDLLRESSGPEPFDMQTLAGRGEQPTAPEFDARSAPNLPNRLLSGQRGEGASAMNDFPRVPSALNAPNSTSGQPFASQSFPSVFAPQPAPEMSETAMLREALDSANAVAQEEVEARFPPNTDTGSPLDGAVMPPVTAEQQARAAAAPPQGPPSQPPPSRAAPTGGGIASMAPQDDGAPSNYEQELLKMLGAREKRAEQDKWMALAEAGMALMSSSQPTFGGALGEAGQAGLGSLRAGTESAEGDRLALLGEIEQSRLGREAMQLQRQAAAARAASGGSSGGDTGPSYEISAGQNRLLGQYENDIESLTQSLNGFNGEITRDQRFALTNQLNEAVGLRASLIGAMSGVPFPRAGSGGTAQLDFDAQ